MKPKTTDISRKISSTKINPAVLMPALLFVLFFSITQLSFAASDKPAGAVRFVQISDVHFNPDRDYAKGRMVKYSQQLLEDAVSLVNGMQGIDFVIFTGDMIDNSSSKLYPQFARIANKLNVPWFWAIGNHDVSPSGMKRAQLLKIINKFNKYIQPGKTCYAFTSNGFLFFSMDGASDTETTSQGSFSRECLSFLDRGLGANPNIPAVIFQHFPLVYPIHSSSHEVRNKNEYMEIIAAHPNARAVFSGHFHITKIKNEGGVLHVSSPALVQYPNAFRVVTLNKTQSGIAADIHFVETRLSDVRSKSRETSPGASLQEGTANDRDAQLLIR